MRELLHAAFLGRAPNASSEAPSRARRAITTRAFFNFGAKKAVAAKRAVRPTVIPEPDFKLPGSFLAIAATLVATEHPIGGSVFGLLGAFLAFQVCSSPRARGRIGRA